MPNKKIKIRKAWRINPRTRIKKSKKLYARKRKKEEMQDEPRTFLQNASSIYEE